MPLSDALGADPWEGWAPARGFAAISHASPIPVSAAGIGLARTLSSRLLPNAAPSLPRK